MWENTNNHVIERLGTETLGGIGLAIGGAQALGGLLGGGGPRAPRCNACQQQQMMQCPQANMACAGHMNQGCQRVNSCCNSFMGNPCGPMGHGLSNFAMAGAGCGDPWGVNQPGGFGGGGFGGPLFNPPCGGGFGFGGGLSFPPGLPGLPMPSMAFSLGVSLNV